MDGERYELNRAVIDSGSRYKEKPVSGSVRLQQTEAASVSLCRTLVSIRKTFTNSHEINHCASLRSATCNPGSHNIKQSQLLLIHSNLTSFLHRSDRGSSIY